jgi:hypothetical protein
MADLERQIMDWKTFRQQSNEQMIGLSICSVQELITAMKPSTRRIISATFLYVGDKSLGWQVIDYLCQHAFKIFLG